MVAIGPESKIRRNPNVQASALAEGEGGVLLHLGSGQYHGVNPVGLVIWELIEEERTLKEILEALRTQIEDPPPELENDVVIFLTSVEERQLVEVE